MIVEKFNKEIFGIIEQLSDQDPFTVLPGIRNYPSEIRKLIAQQISSRKKVAVKIPEWIDFPDIIFPEKKSIEQASSSVTAQYKSGLISGGTVLDLTGGMGIDSFFFAKTATRVIYVEIDKQLCEIARHNFRKLGLTNIEIHNKDAVSYLLDFSQHADLVYLDPSRRKGNQRIFKLEDAEPDIFEILPFLRKLTSSVIIKAAPFADITYILKKVPDISEIHIVAARKECKELLICLDLLNTTEDPPVISVYLNQMKPSVYRSTFKREARTDNIYMSSGKFLFDPNPAVRKSGMFHSLGTDFGLSKLSPNSHLYLGQEKIENFPGKVYEILNVISYRKLIRDRSVAKANIILRNFPVLLGEIRKKTGIIDGGDIYLFGSRDINNKLLFFVTRR